MTRFDLSKTPDDVTSREWMLARIEEIIEENANLLGEEPELAVRIRHDGVRIQVRKDGRWLRGEYQHYRSMHSAYSAALIANQNAYLAHERLLAEVEACGG